MFGLAGYPFNLIQHGYRISKTLTFPQESLTESRYFRGTINERKKLLTDVLEVMLPEDEAHADRALGLIRL